MINSINRTNLFTKLIALFAMFFAFTFAGCDVPPGADEPVNYGLSGAGGSTQSAGSQQSTGGTQSTSSGSPQTGKKVTYDLPNGWKKDDQGALYIVPTVNGKNTTAQLDFNGVQDGSDADAEKLIHDSQITANYRSLNVGNVKIYIRETFGGLATPETYQDADSNVGTSLAFSKNGKVFSFILYGYKIEEYKDAMKKITDTIKVS